ncbi:MAG: Acetylspermidine deacetylase [Myxococcaceae bacterium]|nr:Acetylspermidine deacetylase [Myxococcaceae bacterium]
MAPPPRLFVIDDERFDLHAAPVPHPEQPARLRAIRRGLVGPLRKSGAELVAPRLATEQELLRVHAPEHVNELRRLLPLGTGVIDDDTFISPGTYDATWLAAGGAALLAERLMASESSTGSVGLLTARPPGHHATRSRAMGFCLLNNVAVGAAAALASGAERVAVLDWDVHHGNGTQAIFEDDPRVLFISLHQFPLYPGTGRSTEIGAGAGRGTTINVPLPAGATSRDYAATFKRVVLPALEQFKPDMLLLSCGFDAHRDDPLGGMLLTDEDYGAFTNLAFELSQRVCKGRLGIVLEGGYDLGALERAGSCVADALLGKSFGLDDGKVPANVERALDDTRQALDAFYDL